MRASFVLLISVLIISGVTAQTSTRCRASSSEVVSSGIVFSGRWNATDEIGRSTLVAGSCADLLWTGSMINWNITSNMSGKRPNFFHSLTVNCKCNQLYRSVALTRTYSFHGSN